MDNQLINPIFIGHGSPINIIKDNSYTNFLKSYAKTIIKPKAIVVISAHWLTRDTYITANPKPGQIYDFYGFPDELYKINYSPIGDKDLAIDISSNISDIKMDINRGIDHAAWAVIMHMFPDGDIRILEISLDIDKTEAEHYELGKKLKEYSEKGILLIGSGNIVHNLRDIDFDDNCKPFNWAIEADQWLKERIENYKIDELLHYKDFMPNYFRAIPTDDHFLPLFYIFGMKEEHNKIKTIFEEIQNGSISMRCFELC